VLAQLLEARVQVADVRRAPRDPLAVELEHEAQRRVRRARVLGFQRPESVFEAPSFGTQPVALWE
jgi:hypothetical protein